MSRSLSARPSRDIVAAAVMSVLALTACGNDELTPEELAEASAAAKEASERMGLSGDRPFSLDYEVRLDPERTVRVQANGAFVASEDRAKAASGMTEILLHAQGTVNVTNVSDGRATDSFSHPMDLMVPVDDCPEWATEVSGSVGSHCTYDLFSVNIPSLDPGETHSRSINWKDDVREVAAADAEKALEAIRADSAVLVGGIRVYWNDYLPEGNPSCPIGDSEWVTFFSESPTVDICATEG